MMASFGLATHVASSSIPSRQSLYSEIKGFSFSSPVKQTAVVNSFRCGRIIIVADGRKQTWSIGRFFKTVAYFNEPPSFGKFLESLTAIFTQPSAKEQAEKGSFSAMDIVLVTGATGGVGKRIVDVLRKGGIPVRVLVRNPEKARRLLGPEVDMVIGDVTQKATLLPEYFEGVKKVVNAVSVIVGPKEGDTPERQKYYQGIKFFAPEVKGDSPETVEYNGMKNLIESVREHLGVRDGKTLFNVSANGVPSGPAWGALDDVVMGGVSESSLQISLNGGEAGGAVGVFKGFVSTDNNGGFASIRTKNFSSPEDLSAYEGLELHLKGDGHRYKLVVRTSTEWDALGYTASFDTQKDQWQSVRLPFSEFIPVFRARTVRNAGPFVTSKVMSLQLMYSKFEYDGKLNPTFEPGQFELPFASIKAYMKEPITPRFVHVSSAGVTRPRRPGLDLSKQPPAVRMNEELGYIMDFKLKGEDVLRESGIPYTIVRPCALTEEPAGAELIFEQGDNITGKISREDVAEICVAALELPSACDLTFEVKCTLPFSEPFKIEPENPPPKREFENVFNTLQKGVTGKEALEKEMVSV